MVHCVDAFMFKLNTVGLLFSVWYAWCFQKLCIEYLI